MEPAHPDTSYAPSDPHGDSLVYSFGTGDGTLHTWTSPMDRDLSGDGAPDAITLDFDGDGRRDDALWDSDDDGRADLVGLDLDGSDGGRFYSDTGRGLWDHRVHDVAIPDRATDPPRAAPPSGPPPAADAPENPPSAPDGVGLVFPAGSTTLVRVLVDLDGDDRADASLVDSDADGVADRWLMRGDPAFADGSGREDEPLRSAVGRRDERG